MSMIFFMEVTWLTFTIRPSLSNLGLGLGFSVGFRTKDIQFYWSKSQKRASHFCWDTLKKEHNLDET